MTNSDSSKAPHFRDLEEKDLLPWLGHPVTKLLRQWLEQDRSIALDHIAECIEQEKIPEARIAKGGLNVINAILASFHPPERRKPDSEPEWKDPASIERRVA